MNGVLPSWVMQSSVVPGPGPYAVEHGERRRGCPRSSPCTATASRLVRPGEPGDDRVDLPPVDAPVVVDLPDEQVDGLHLFGELDVAGEAQFTRERLKVDDREHDVDLVGADPSGAGAGAGGWGRPTGCAGNVRDGTAHRERDHDCSGGSTPGEPPASPAGHPHLQQGPDTTGSVRGELGASTRIGARVTTGPGL